MMRSNGTFEMTPLPERYFVDGLKDIYWAEKQLLKVLPRIFKVATIPELKETLEEHITQTEDQVRRLELIFEYMGKKVQATKCFGMEGIIQEFDFSVDKTEPGSVTRDAAITIGLQKVNHYEMAAYGGLIQIAKGLGRDQIANLLDLSLDEEKLTYQTLEGIAEYNINWAAELEEIYGYIDGEE